MTVFMIIMMGTNILMGDDDKQTGKQIMINAYTEDDGDDDDDDDDMIDDDAGET